jgi:hypothetical protein
VKKSVYLGFVLMITVLLAGGIALAATMDGTSSNETLEGTNGDDTLKG